MNPRMAADKLGLDVDEITVESVTRAAADAIKKAHPDSGGDAEQAPAQIALAKRCREVLLEHIGSGIEPGKRECPVCRGRGVMASKGRFKAPDCIRCKGEGTIPL